jgi:hypothetical protein
MVGFWEIPLVGDDLKFEILVCVSIIVSSIVRATAGIKTRERETQKLHNITVDYYAYASYVYLLIVYYVGKYLLNYLCKTVHIGKFKRARAFLAEGQKMTQYQYRKRPIDRSYNHGRTKEENFLLCH